jgi:hypothetical protein
LVGGTTLPIVAVAVAIGLLVSLLVFGSDPNTTWWRGWGEPIRNVFFRPNGAWRRFGRLGLLCAIAAMALVGALVSLRHAA